MRLIRDIRWETKKMNSYIKGRRYEYEVKKILTRLGYIVLRSAGSHGLFDLIAIHPITKNVIFIQVKKEKRIDENIKRIKELFKDFGKVANVQFQLWYKEGKEFKSESLLK